MPGTISYNLGTSNEQESKSCYKASKLQIFFIPWIFNFILIVLGAAYFDSCPGQIELPYFLIIAGSIGLIGQIVSFIRFWLQPPYYEFAVINEAFLYIGSCMIIALGTYWTYHFDRSSDPGDFNYCHAVIYMLSFINVTAFWILFVLMYIVSSILVAMGAVQHSGEQ